VNLGASPNAGAGLNPDTGAADPALVAALGSRDPVRILPLLEGARLLVAVIAIPGEDHASEGEMALAMLESASGERALPAFTSLDALTRWNAAGRPVPRAAAEVVAYALAESLEAVVIDPGAPHSWTLWRDAFAPDSPDSPDSPDNPDNPEDPDSPDNPEDPETGYVMPSWRPSRKARQAASPYEVYAVDAPAGSPAIAVFCPEGTLDTAWAERLLARCPIGTAVMALPVDARERLVLIGKPMARSRR
jgi:hypothetical protein